MSARALRARALAEYEEGVRLSAQVIDDTDASGVPTNAAPPTPNAWKLDALAVGALVAGGLFAFLLRRMA